MSTNAMITAIKNDLFYSRYYFNEDAILNNRSRCKTFDSLAVQKALDNGVMTFMKEKDITMKDFKDEKYPAKDKYIQISFVESPCILNVRNCRLMRYINWPNCAYSEGSHEQLLLYAEHYGGLSFTESSDGSLITIKLKNSIDHALPKDYLELTIDKSDNIVSLRLSDGTEIPKEQYANYIHISYIATVPVDVQEYQNNKGKCLKYFIEGTYGIIKDGIYEYNHEIIDVPPITETFNVDQNKRFKGDFTF